MLDKEKKRNVANEHYKREELLWASLTKQYYAPYGAPMRLAKPLLEQWHRKNNSGIKDPADIEGYTVKVFLDEQSYIIKRFVTKKSADKYISSLKVHEIDCQFISIEEAYNFGQ